MNNIVFNSIRVPFESIISERSTLSSSVSSRLSCSSITSASAEETATTVTTIPGGEQSKTSRSRTSRLLESIISRNGSNKETGQGPFSVSVASSVTASGANQGNTISILTSSSPSSFQANKGHSISRRVRSFSVSGVTFKSKRTGTGRIISNTRTSTVSSTISTKSINSCRRGKDSFLTRMLRLNRTHSVPISTIDSSSSSVGNARNGRSRTNTFSFPVIHFHRTLSDKNSKGVSSTRPRSTAAPLSGASFAAVVSANHHGNFFQLSDYNLDLLIQTLTGKNSTALETISIKSAAISVADARLLAKLIRSSDAANIKVLKLDRNAISHDAFKHIFDAWKHNRTITALCMSRSGVDDKAIKYIARALVKAETLRELDLSHNKITAQGIQVLCEALILNRSVTRLCIESNNIKKAGAPHLAGLLAKNCAIRHLNVGSNGLGAEGCSMIADAIRLNGTLNSLSLDMNEMGSIGASAMAAALASNQRLTHLYIPHNNIGDQGLTEICESLKKNNSLISLDVELNQIGHGQSVAGMKALAEVLRTNKHLREINLSYNVFSSEAIQELMKGAADNSTLESIILTNCCITTQGATTIAEVLPTATGLQNLGLTANLDIAEEGYQALATNLSKNRSMKGIQLDYNSEDRHVLYESIQSSLTRNFIWQQAVYAAACRILTLSRIVLLGRPANQKTNQSQRLQQQQPQGGGAWSLLKKVGLGRTSSSNSLGSLLSLGKNRISVDPSSPATSNYEDSGEIHGADTPSISRKNSRQGAHPSANPPPFPLVQHNHSFDGNHLLVPYQQQQQKHGMDSELLYVSTQARSSPDPVTEDCNAHKVMANLVNMPHEIFESICAFLDHGQNMSIAQIRTTIRMAGDKSTLSESYTKARMLERIFHSRYIPPIGMRYGVKNADERV
ncbi:hypothetical protein BGX34_007940 [Mortierella sp. NVP85]|nr:hypothetical protein BGX34_007940 [Mortierella sp. NVP85]